MLSTKEAFHEPTAAILGEILPIDLNFIARAFFKLLRINFP